MGNEMFSTKEEKLCWTEICTKVMISTDYGKEQKIELETSLFEKIEAHKYDFVLDTGPIDADLTEAMDS